MELPVTKSKKKKTLQIVYPAPYAQSQALNPDTSARSPVVVKNNVQRGPRGPKKVAYPAPHSHSWNTADVAPVIMKKHELRAPRCPNRLCRTPRQGDPMRAWSHQFENRPDPTAPHLKYGVFRNRRASAVGPLPSQERPQKPERPQKIERFPKVSAPTPKRAPTKRVKPKWIENPIIRVPQEPISTFSSCSSAVPEKPPPVKEKIELHPIFVSRTITESYSRKLCQSKIMHIEIKPGKTPPLWPTSSQRLTISPVIRKRNTRDRPVFAIP